MRLTTIAVFTACTLINAPAALAQSTPSPTTRRPKSQQPAAPVTLAPVVVTGTRTSGLSASQSLAPVEVIDAQRLTATGAPDLESALRILLPSFNFPQPSQLGATDATMPAQLRGLSPDDTLVLINGKRQHTTAIVNVDGPMIGRGSSPVDLSAIPISAIARIEVLRDGAAAQYGSDAIAGVINIILKSGPGQGSFSLQRGQRNGGEGQTWKSGFSDGFGLGQNGWLRLSADWTDQDPTNHIGPDRRFPGDPQYDTRAAHYGLPKKVARQFALNGQYRLGNDATLYAFSVFNQRDVNAGGAFHSLSEYATISPPAAAVYPDGFLPMRASAINDTMMVLGLRGYLAAWHYDLSLSHGGSRTREHTTRSFNYSLGSASPTAFYDGKLSLDQDIFNADFQRDVGTPWHAPLSLAWGLALRRERYGIEAGDAASFAGRGAEGSFGYRPDNAGTHRRHNRALYLDLQSDLTSTFSAEAAARYERYSDFGHATVWKLSARQALGQHFALRGTVSTGFRAPSLQQEFYSSTTVEYLNNVHGFPVPYLIGTFPVDNPAAIALGAQPLQPERSRNLSIGAVYTPATGPTLTLDVYQIRIRNRIILSGDLVGPAVTAYLTSVGLPGITGGRFFTNAATTRTRGGDFTADWPIDLALGHLHLRGGANYTHTSLLAVKPNPPQLGLAGLTLPVMDRAERGRVTLGTPRTKAFVAASLQRKHWTFRAQLTRYGQWGVLGDTTAGDQTYGARYLLDLAASYTRGPMTLTLGGNNVTNTYPERNNAQNSFAGIIPYPFSSPFGFNGSYWYVQVGYRW